MTKREEPKVFVSYSWSSPGHRAQVREWAEQLIADGVDVVLDEWDLNEGDDKYAFMERMVNDESVTHVLLFSDRDYAAKADERRAGVGAESQIVSKEIYESIRTSKFIPLVCEFDKKGEPCLPAFLQSRIFIDFSSPEAVNENWERLIRRLFGRPELRKPQLGKPPEYILEGSDVQASPESRKLAVLRDAVFKGKPRIDLYRDEFLSSAIQHADSLRVRERPGQEDFGKKVLADCAQLKAVRNHLVDWVLLESNGDGDGFSEALLELLEELLELKSRPRELNAAKRSWFEAHAVFVYETFLYLIAALLKTGSFAVVHAVLTSHYLLPESSGRSESFDNFREFLGFSDALQILAPEGRLHFPAAELIKRQADRRDLPFEAIMEAEAVVLMMALINPESHWIPQTLVYARRSEPFPLFLRATQSRHFAKIATITGIKDADALREAVRAGQARLAVDTWQPFFVHARSFWDVFNLERLNTLN